MNFDYVSYKQLDDIVKITFDRPDVMNVISRKVYAELDAALAAVEEEFLQMLKLVREVKS